MVIYSTSRWNPSSSVHWYTVHPTSPGTWTCTVTPKAVCTRAVSFRKVSIFFTPPARTSYNGTHQKSVLLGRRMGRPSFRKEMGLLDPTLGGVKFSKFVFGRPPVFCSRLATFHQQPHSTNDCSSQKGWKKMWLHHKDWTSYVPKDSNPRSMELEHSRLPSGKK